MFTVLHTHMTFSKTNRSIIDTVLQRIIQIDIFCNELTFTCLHPEFFIILLQHLLLLLNDTISNIKLLFILLFIFSYQSLKKMSNL